MSFKPSQFREVIRSTLFDFDPRLCTPAAIELLMLTAAAESHLGRYLYQDDGDPEIENNLALGVFQMEAFTYRDIRDRVILRKYPGLPVQDAADLITDLRLAIVAARMKYWSIPKALPGAEDVMSLARYWKRYYNTWMGAGTIRGAMEKYRRYCL